METLRSRVVIDDLVFPEGIRWHQGKLWFSDILDRKVYAHDPETGQTEVVVETEDRPSGLGFLPDGRLLIVGMQQRTLQRLDADGLKTVVDLKAVATYLNDMVVDPHGRAYLDAQFSDPPATGGIILVEPDGDFRIVADGMEGPNGLAITADGKTFVVNDFSANRLVAFDVAADGGLANRRIFADLGGDSPDGLCLDAEGAAWVGLPFQGRFRRIREGGEVTHEIAYADRWGVAPALGGADRRTLFLCTAEVTLEKLKELMLDSRDARKECRGRIEVVEGIAIPGAGWP